MSYIDELFKKQKYAKTVLLKIGKKKSNFISSYFVILLLCYLGRVFLHKNPRNICVAIRFGFTQKIASLPRLYVCVSCFAWLHHLVIFSLGHFQTNFINILNYTSNATDIVFTVGAINLNFSSLI